MGLIELYLKHYILTIKISPIKWMKIPATIQSLSMQMYGVVVKKISKKESKRMLWWPQNVQCQL